MRKVSGLFRNACIAAVCGLSANAAMAEGTGLADAAGKAMEAAQADVTATSPKVLLVVALVTATGIVISLIRKA
ncbi:Flexible pilin [Aeromonas veronii]|uniref:Flexible pilin n=1 Tax=Aeromonas veronii TaxID=654 RepID=UPI0032EC7432